MIHLRGQDNVYIDASLVGFTKQLRDNGIVARQVDLLLIGAAYAISKGLPPMKVVSRHDLIHVARIDPDIVLALEASLAWYAREQELSPPKDHSSLLEMLAQTGSSGLRTLRKEWKDLSTGQRRLRLLRLCQNSPT